MGPRQLIFYLFCVLAVRSFDDSAFPATATALEELHSHLLGLASRPCEHRPLHSLSAGFIYCRGRSSSSSPLADQELSWSDSSQD